MCYSRRQKILFYSSKSVRLAVAVYRFTCFCKAILPITEPSHKLFALSNIIDFLLTLFLSWLGNWYPDRLNIL